MPKVELELLGRIQSLEKSLSNVDSQMQDLSKQTKKTSDDVEKNFNRGAKTMEFFKRALVSALSIGAVVQFTKAIINVRSEFEKYGAVLKNTLGSARDAAEAMNMIKTFAAQTPFSVQELTSSYVKLVNQGFKPTEKELRKLGDLAASTGKSFDQLTEAIIDAQVGEFERLKEFGIRAQKEGDRVIFTFKGVQKQVDFTSAAIQDYIVGLGDLRGVTGSMEAISKTLGGRISNLGDSWDSLLNTMGARTTGVFGQIISGLGSIIDKTSAWLEIPASEELEKQRLEMVSLVGAITDVNISTESRLTLIEELQTTYPQYFGSLDSEKVKNEELRDVMKEINEAFEERIKLSVIGEEITELETKLFDALKDEREAFKQLTLLREKYGDITLEDIANATAAEKQLNQVIFSKFTDELYAIQQSQLAQEELRNTIAEVNIEYAGQKAIIQDMIDAGKAGFETYTGIAQTIMDYEEGIVFMLATQIAAIDNELLGLAEDSEEFAKTQDFLNKWVTENTKKTYAQDVKDFEDAQEQKRQAARTVARGLSELYSTLSDLVRINKEKELSAVGDNEEKRLAIERKYARKEQELAIGKALMTQAQVILNAALTQPFIPAGLAATITAGILAAAQIAVIKQQKFAHGGFEVLKGRRHYQGGINIGIGEAEDGEGIGVFSRKAMSKYGSLIPSLMAALNNGVFPDIATKSLKDNINKLQVSLDDSRQLEEIKKLLAKKEKTIRIENGYRIEEYRGVTKKIRL